MSQMMCHDDFIGSRMFDSSHIHNRVHIRVHVVGYDMTGCGMMWNSIRLCSSGIHIHTGLMFTCD